MKDLELPRGINVIPVNGIMEQGEFEYWTATGHGIQFKDDTPREVWLNAVKEITTMFESSGRLHCRSMFYVADAMNAGESLFGEEYAQAIDNTRQFLRLSAKTISNAMWVAGKIPSERRRETLSLAHHEIVAKLPDQEQEEFLRIAEEEGLNTKELKEKVREKHPGKPRQSKNGSESSTKFNITDAKTAKDAATQLSNWLTENEETITDAWKPLLEHFYKLYRRHWMTGRKRE